MNVRGSSKARNRATPRDNCEAVGPAGLTPSRKVVAHKCLREDGRVPGARETAELFEKELLPTVGIADGPLVHKETLDLGSKDVHGYTSASERATERKLARSTWAYLRVVSTDACPKMSEMVSKATPRRSRRVAAQCRNRRNPSFSRRNLYSRSHQGSAHYRPEIVAPGQGPDRRHMADKDLRHRAGRASVTNIAYERFINLGEQRKLEPSLAFRLH